MESVGDYSDHVDAKVIRTHNSLSRVDSVRETGVRRAGGGRQGLAEVSLASVESVGSVGRRQHLLRCCVVAVMAVMAIFVVRSLAARE